MWLCTMKTTPAPVRNVFMKETIMGYQSNSPAVDLMVALAPALAVLAAVLTMLAFDIYDATHASETQAPISCPTQSVPAPQVD